MRNKHLPLRLSGQTIARTVPIFAGVQKQVPRKQSFPVWLRKLRIVKMELRGTRWPTTEEGFRQGIVLMTEGLRALEREKARGGSRATWAGFSASDERWTARWREERDKVFPHRAKPRP